jgi:hypothetical protein
MRNGEFDYNIYWANRLESAAACAAPFVQSLRSLTRTEPIFAKASEKVRKIANGLELSNVKVIWNPEGRRA